ncbi:MAG: fused MFS/spermidine synthase, partial [bacterium]
MSKKMPSTSRQRASRMVAGFVFSVFFLSGTCGLMYEVVWSRMLVLVVGGSTYATSIVLASFMAGMAFGSYIFGKLADRSNSPLCLYGFLQIGIGAYGVLLPVIISGTTAGYVALSGRVSSGIGLNLVRLLLAFAVLMVPTFLMGGSFPLVSRYIVRKLSKFGAVVGALYSVNTWGGVLGSFAAGMFLLARIGMKGTLFLAAGVNILIGIATFALGSRSIFRAYFKPTPKVDVQPVDVRIPSSDRTLRMVAVAILGVSGFTSLAYEVFWTRMLIFVIGNSTWSFTVVLTTFLAGLALGSFVVSRFLDRMRRPLTILAFIQLGIGFVAVIFIPFFGRLNSLQVLFPGLAPHLLLFQFTVSCIAMLGPTVLIGMVFPFALKLYVREASRIGSGAGKGYSINTISSIAGALAGGFILIPFLGLRNGIVTVAAVNVLAGVFLLASEKRISARSRVVLVSLAPILFAILTIVLPGAIYMGGSLAGTMDRIYYHDGVGGTVEVYQTRKQKIKNLTINGVPEVPTDWLSMQTFRMPGHLPLLLQDEPKRVLIVTFGGGIVAGTVGEHDLETIDCIEICPGVVRAARLFSTENNNVLENPRVRIHIDDGRNFLLTTRKTYDVITADATHPSGADSWVLYTQENYRLFRDRLSDNGILAQWLPLHGLSNSDFRVILKTFSSVFPNTSVWFIGANPNFGHAIVLGLKSDEAIPIGRVRERLNERSVREDMEPYGLDDVYALLSRFLLDSRGVALYVGGMSVNTDNLPWIAFTPRLRFGHNLNALNLTSMLHLASEPTFFRMTSQEKDSLRVYMKARKHTITGMLAICMKDPVVAYEELKSALKMNPKEEDAANLLES